MPEYGFRPREDLVGDELAIRHLCHAFADACNRRDLALFDRLWDVDCRWEIGEPKPASATGREAIGTLVRGLLDNLEFFVQNVHSGYVVIDPYTDVARASWTMYEMGRWKDGTPYENAGMYLDELVKREGSWRFSVRSYRYLWLDAETPIAGKPFPVDKTLSRSLDTIGQ